MVQEVKSLIFHHHTRVTNLAKLDNHGGEEDKPPVTSILDTLHSLLLLPPGLLDIAVECYGEETGPAADSDRAGTTIGSTQSQEPGVSSIILLQILLLSSLPWP